MAWCVKKQGDTRRERAGKAAKMFGPMRALVAQLREDAVDSIQGAPIITVTGLHMNAAQSLEDLAGIFAVISPADDFAPIVKIAKRLDNGVPLTLDDVDAAGQAIGRAEAIYMTVPLKQIEGAIAHCMVKRHVEEHGVPA